MPTPVQVFVLDKRKKPLMPCHPARARELLREGRAVVHRLVPFTIRLKDRVGGDVQPVRVCEDPGSKTTGIAVVRETHAAEASLDTNGDDDVSGPTRTVLFKMELTHRSADIHKRMESRRNLRRGRRGRKTRYRAPRFDNRASSRRRGRLPPSLKHRVETTMTWTRRLSRLVPVTAISVERVRFDTQLMVNPEISGVEYQQGTLKGYETREYVLEKWGRSCAYCDAENVPLQMDHVRPKSRGGSSRPTDFVPACGPCNQKKGAQPVETFLKRDPKRLAKIVAGLQKPMRDAAAVNSTRNSLDAELRTLGVPVDAASGGCTKWNRHRFNVPKTHANDAVCVGKVGGVAMLDRPTLYVRCAGRGDYGRTNVTASGFPRGYKMREKYVHGFRTGDVVRAVVPSGKKQGTHTGRVAVRATGNFAVFTNNERVDGIWYRHCRVVQRADGYDYARGEKRRAATNHVVFA